MIDWHRWLGDRTASGRAIGKAITGACNAAFLFLALSGLYLWWPRRWNRAAMRLSLWFRRGLAGRARDFNWHNVIGFWSLPVLIVMTTSGMMISYRWVSNLIYTRDGGDRRRPGRARPRRRRSAPPAPPPGAQRWTWMGCWRPRPGRCPDWKSATWSATGARPAPRRWPCR